MSRGRSISLTADDASAEQHHSIGSEDSWRIRFHRYVKTIDLYLTSGHVLNEFVREAAMPYLEDDSPEVRKEAVLASTQLLVHDPICGQTSVHSVEIVSDVLGKLLTVGITDACES